MCGRCGAIKQIALFASLSNQERSARRTTRGAAPVHVIANRSKAFGLNVQLLPHGRGTATTTVSERLLNMVVENAVMIRQAFSEVPLK